MSARKGSISGGASSSVMKSRQSPIHIDTEYTAAVAVLNEANMALACELLLSERDYNYDSDQGDDDGHEHETDHQKLLELFSKCEAACKVIQQRAPPPAVTLMPTLLQQRVPAPAARAVPQASKPLGKPTTTVKTMIPPRRGLLMTQTSRAALKTGPPGTSQRETMDSLMMESNSVGSAGSSAKSSKKARLSPPALVPPLPSGGLAPPPAAMSFLAALNAQKEKQEKKEVTRELSHDVENDLPPRKTRSMSPPPPAAGERKQPPRNARRG